MRAKYLLPTITSIALMFVVTAQYSYMLADGWYTPPYISSPYEFWRKNRERFGFPPASAERVHVDGTLSLPALEINDIAAAERRYKDQLKQYTEEQDPALKEVKLRELAQLRQAIGAYGLSTPKLPGEQRRKAYIHHLIGTLAYINDDNIAYAEFPELMQNRDRYMDEIVLIMKEIGPTAARQLWDHLRAELAFVKLGRDESRQRARDLEKRLAEVRRKQTSASDRQVWEAFETEALRLTGELASAKGEQTKPDPSAPMPDATGAPLPGFRSPEKTLTQKLKEQQGFPGLAYDIVGITISKDFVERLSASLLAIGPGGISEWVQGVWDLNPVVRSHARQLLQRMGLACVPELTTPMRKTETTPTQRDFLAEALAAVTGLNYGQDADRYDAWYEKQNIKPLPDLQPMNERPNQAPEHPPITPLKEPAKGEPVVPPLDELEIQIGPRR